MHLSLSTKVGLSGGTATLGSYMGAGDLDFSSCFHRKCPSPVGHLPTPLTGSLLDTKSEACDS